MTKRLSDTSALTAQGLKFAGNQYAEDKSVYDGETPATPAYGSADREVDAEKIRAEAQARWSMPYTVPKEPSCRETGAGNSALSAAVKICKE